MKIFPSRAVKCRTCSKPARRTADTVGPLKKSERQGKRTHISSRTKTRNFHRNERNTFTEYNWCIPMSRLFRRLCSLSVSKASPANTSIGLVPSGHLLACNRKLDFRRLWGKTGVPSITARHGRNNLSQDQDVTSEVERKGRQQHDFFLSCQ